MILGVGFLAGLFNTYAANTIVGAVYSTYAAGKTATADTQFFNVTSSDGLTLRVYQKTGTVAKYVGTIPSQAATGAQSIYNAIMGQTLGTMPQSPLVDIDSTSIYYHATQFKNIGSSDIVDNNIVRGIPFQKTTSSGSITITDVVGKAYNYQVAFAAENGAGFSHFINMPTDQNEFYVPEGQWTFGVELSVPAGAASVDVFYGYVFDAGGSSYSQITLTETPQTVSLGTIHNDSVTQLTGYKFVIAPDRTGTHAAKTIIVGNPRLIPGSSPGTASQVNTSPVLNWGLNNIAKGIATGRSYKQSQITGGKNNSLQVVFDNALNITESTLIIAFNQTEHATPPYTVLYSNQSSQWGIFNGKYIDHAVTYGQIESRGYNLANGKWYILAITANASGSSMYVNGHLVANNAIPVSSYTLKKLYFLGSDRSLNAQCMMSNIAYWNKKLTSSEIVAATDLIKQRMATKGINLNDSDVFYISEGDSISWMSGSWTHLIRDSYTPYLSGACPAESGSKLGAAGDTLPTNGNDTDPHNTMYARQSWVNSVIQEQISLNKKVVMTIKIGTNDSDWPTTAAVDTYFDKLMTYVATARGLGAKVAACTIIDNGQISDKTRIAYYNNKLRAAQSQFDGFIDFYANSAFQTASTTYYVADLIHPNATGFALMKDIAKPVVDYLLTL